MANALRKLKTNAAALVKLAGYKEKLLWSYNHRYWWNDRAINEVPVDFN